MKVEFDIDAWAAIITQLIKHDFGPRKMAENLIPSLCLVILLLFPGLHNPLSSIKLINRDHGTVVSNPPLPTILQHPAASESLYMGGLSHPPLEGPALHSCITLLVSMDMIQHKDISDLHHILQKQNLVPRCFPQKYL